MLQVVQIILSWVGIHAGSAWQLRGRHWLPPGQTQKPAALPLMRTPSGLAHGHGKVYFCNRQVDLPEG